VIQLIKLDGNEFFQRMKSREISSMDQNYFRFEGELQEHDQLVQSSVGNIYNIAAFLALANRILSD
jgi:hypothetical protein